MKKVYKKSEVLKEGYFKGLKAALKVIRQQLNETPLITPSNIGEGKLKNRAIIKEFIKNYTSLENKFQFEKSAINHLLANPVGHNFSAWWETNEKCYWLYLDENGQKYDLCRFIIDSYDGNDQIDDFNSETSVTFSDVGPASILFTDKKLSELLNLGEHISNKELRNLIYSSSWKYQNFFTSQFDDNENNFWTVTDHGTSTDKKILNNLFRILELCNQDIIIGYGDE